MNPIIPLGLAAGLLALASTASAASGPIARACLDSARPNATLALCSCIQGVADQTLQRSEQRQAVRFFRDPHRAQVVRQSRSDGDRRFWERYRSFGAAAEERCGIHTARR